jgi:hypothetical protein
MRLVEVCFHRSPRWSVYHHRNGPLDDSRFWSWRVEGVCCNRAVQKRFVRADVGQGGLGRAELQPGSC